MIPSLTQYDLLATSTCVSIGAGGTRCVYEYRKEISTTTTPQATTTVNFEIVGTIGVLFAIGIVVAVIVTNIVRRLT